MYGKWKLQQVLNPLTFFFARKYSIITLGSKLAIICFVCCTLNPSHIGNAQEVSAGMYKMPCFLDFRKQILPQCYSNICCIECDDTFLFTQLNVVLTQNKDVVPIFHSDIRMWRK